jgi:hypothetical protein
MTAKILASCLLFIGCVAGQDKPAPQRGQLEFKLTSMARNSDGNVLTAAVTITNKSPYYVFFLLVNKPHAVTDAGEEFDVVQSVNGVAYCKGFDSYPGNLTAKDVCVRNKEDSQGAWVSPANYTEIDPDASAVFRGCTVGSRTGAVFRRSGLACYSRFLMECLNSPTVNPSPAPASSHPACRFPT